MKPLTMILTAAAALVLALLFVRRGALPARLAGAGNAAPKTNRKTAPSSVGIPASGSSSAGTLKKILEGGDPPKLTAEQLGAFVEEEKHSVASLLAAWQMAGDPAWLEEAAQRYPDNPRVALAKLAAIKELDAGAAEWVRRLKQADPGNAIGWCYDALIAFKEGSPAAARAALAEAAQRGRFDVHASESAAELAKAYRGAGMDGFAADVLGLFGVPLPQAQLAMKVQREAISQLGGNLDDALVQDMLKLATAVRGEGEEGFLITKLVGSAMERKLLAELSTLDLVPGTRTFVLERMSELDSERSVVRDLAQKTAPLMQGLNESELRQYFKRSAVEGELKAMQWLLARHPEAR